MATADQTAVIRSWIGTSATLPADLDARLIRLGTPEAVALELLRQRRADLLTAPTKIQVDGDVTIDLTGTIDGIDKLIAALESTVGAEASGVGRVTTSTIGRPPTRCGTIYRL